MQKEKLERAKQFMPFDSLKGFREAIAEKEREVEEKAILSIDKEEELNKIISSLEVGDEVEINFYINKHYVKEKIIIKTLKILSNKIIINDKEFNFKNIRDLKIVD